MHYWGDKWFQEHGDHLYAAIKETDKALWKAKIGCLTKEKYGTRREDMLKLWDGGWYTIIYGPRFSYQPWKYYKWKPFRKLVEGIHSFVYWLDHRIVPWTKTKYGWLYKGLADFHRWLGIVALVNKRQAKQYNKIFQLACKKYPDIVDELILDAEGYKMIKPCKWGDVDGEKIHNKYWKTLSDEDIEKEKQAWMSMIPKKE